MSLKIIDLYGEVAAEVFPKYFSLDRCVNSTRVTIEVMRKFRVPAYLLVTEAIAVNKAFAERLLVEPSGPGSREGTERWFQESGAHSLGVGFGSDDRPHRFEGHLVAIVRGVLVDSAADQMSRPAHAMSVPPILALNVVSDAFLRGEEGTGIVLDDGTHITYRAFPDRKHYQTTDGFQAHPHNLDVAREIITEMKRRM